MNEPATPSPARRYRPRLLPTVATVAGIALFVTAGQWQQRPDGAEAGAARAVRRGGRHGARRIAAGRCRLVRVAVSARVAAEGVFDAARQILIDNKIDEGRAGYHVVTPLVLRDGRAVLVDRGWIAAGRNARAAARGPAAGRGRHCPRPREHSHGELCRAVARCAGGRRLAEPRPVALRGAHRASGAADRRGADGADRRRPTTWSATGPRPISA